MKKILPAICALAFTGFSLAQTTNGLVAYYSFNNGTANDGSSYANHGTVSGATPTTDRFGNASKAYYFDGTGQMITAPHAAQIDLNQMSAFTISAWVNFDSDSYGLQSIVTKWNGSTSEQYGLFLQDNDAFVAVRTVNSNGVGDNQNLPDSTWHHFVFMFDKNSSGHGLVVNNGPLQGYIPGLTYANSTDITSLSIGAQANDFNGGPFNPTRGFYGKIDDVRIYNRILDSTEIAGLYFEPDPGQASLNEGQVAQISVSPNPANDVVNLSGTYTVVIMDLTGRVVLKAENTNSFNVSKLKQEVYLLNIYDNNNQLLQSEKLIVH